MVTDRAFFGNTKQHAVETACLKVAKVKVAKFCRDASCGCGLSNLIAIAAQDTLGAAGLSNGYPGGVVPIFVGNY